MRRRYPWKYHQLPFVPDDRWTVPSLRLAQTMGNGQGWSKQLGGMGAIDPDLTQCPPGWPEGVPCVLPSKVPGGPSLPIMTEEECAGREVAAYERGKRDEAGSVIKTAAISAAVSAVVGIVIGRLIK